MTSSTPPLAVIVGVGPGLGSALAARFATGGYALALLSRSEHARQPALTQLAAHGHAGCGYDCDAGDLASVAAAFARVRKAQGQPAVLIYNAGMFLQGGILELDPARFETAGGRIASVDFWPRAKCCRQCSMQITGQSCSLAQRQRCGAAPDSPGWRSASLGCARWHKARHANLVRGVSTSRTW
jgi:hypothetical protein